MNAASARPQPSIGRATLVTGLASASGALGGSLGMILWTMLAHASPAALGTQLFAGLVLWLLTAPLAILLGGLPALVGVVLVGWPIALLLNSRGWFGPVSMIVAGALAGGGAGFLILPVADMTEEFPVVLLAGLLGGAGAGLGLLPAFRRAASLDSAPPRA